MSDLSQTERLIKLAEAMLGLLEHFDPTVAQQMKEELDEIKSIRLESDLDCSVPWSEGDEDSEEVPGPQVNDIQDP